ncbi:MAG: hypothetical protein LKI77_06865 [Bifidobacterium sp.]|jgi:hypothetical protein|nr:hypothetical protein [Bifidobacterium sp.]
MVEKRNKDITTIVADPQELSVLEQTMVEENRAAGLDIEFTQNPDDVDPLVYDEA